MDERIIKLCLKFLKIFIIWILAVFTLQWVFCDERSVSPQIDYDPELNVFALLILNNQQKIVRVGHSYRIDKKIPESEGITNAQVTIGSDNQNVIFEHAGEGNYRDVHNELDLISGTRYNLKVAVPDGRKVTGSCVMPSKPQISSPQEYQQVAAHHPLNVAWQASDFTHRYICVLSDLEKDFTPSQYTDSTATTFYTFFFAEPDVYTLKVIASDQNYYDHIRTGEDDQDIVHVKGGLGVFGALAYDEVIFLAK